MRTIPRLLVVGACLLAPACSEDEGPKIPLLSGVWSGTAGDAPAPVAVFEMTLSQTEKTVSGEGSISVNGQLVTEFTVSGTNSHPLVQLTFSAPTFEAANFAGSFTHDDLVEGILNGSGFNGESLSIGRQ